MNGKNVSATLIAQLEQRLRNQNEAADQVLQQIELALREMGTNRDALIQEEYQLQAADDISVRNVINAMRLVSNIDWSEFVENVGLVDAMLREYPGFAAMDFPTRDRYRRAIEKLARRAPLDEIAVASASVREAPWRARAMAARERATPAIISSAAVRPGLRTQDRLPAVFFPTLLARRRRHRPGRLCVLHCPWSRAVPGGACSGGQFFIGLGAGVAGGMIAIMAVLALLPASDVAVALVNRSVTNRWGPRSLPALALKEGVPDSLKTLLVVPVLLTVTRIPLTTRSRGWRCTISPMPTRGCALSCYPTGPTAMRVNDAPSDDGLLERARAGIRELNERYAKNGPPLFLLLHRKRLWNAAQQRWMGWERKRGKLHELNRLLRGATDTSFLVRMAESGAGSCECPLCHYPGRRYQAAARRRQAPGRQDGASAQPAVLRSQTAPRDARTWHPAATRDALAADRNGKLPLSMGIFRTKRAGPIRLCCLRRLPGPVRGGIIRRQGHLRCRCF